MLAELVSLSPFYFQRLFKSLVNKPVQEYIKLRRLSKTIEQLNTNEQRILDIAIDYGFSSHANFTRAFKETYSITPEEYKKSHPMLNTIIKPEISMNDTLIDEGIPLVIEDIVLEIESKKLVEPENYIGFAADVAIAAQIPIGESTGIDIPGQLWTRFHKKKSVLTEYVNPAIELEMSYMADSERGSFQYFTGALLQVKMEHMADFVMQKLPAGDYIVCKIEAESFIKLVTEALDKAGRYLFGTWLPHHQLTCEPFSAEKYYTLCKNGFSMELWVKILDRDN